MSLRRENVRMVGKLAVVAAGMFAFGYALVPVYKAICEMTGINILALGEKDIPGAKAKLPANTEVLLVSEFGCGASFLSLGYLTSALEGDRFCFAKSKDGEAEPVSISDFGAGVYKVIAKGS